MYSLISSPRRETPERRGAQTGAQGEGGDEGSKGQGFEGSGSVSELGAGAGRDETCTVGASMTSDDAAET